MGAFSRALALGVLAASVGAGGAARALTVTVTFPGGGLSTAAFSGAEQAVITEAANQWSAAIGGSHAVTVAFVQSDTTNVPDLIGNLGFASGFAADGGMANGRQVGNPTSATVFINDAIAFFIDASPSDDIEFSPSMQAGAPSTFLDGGPGGHDLLTVALHEIGHSIGFDSDFEGFWAGGTVSTHPASNGRAVYAFQSPASSGNPDYDAGIVNGLTDGGVYLLPSANENEDFVNAGKTTHADDVGGAALGAGYFPFDLMNPALNQSERILISDMNTDVLCDAYAAYSCVAVPEPDTAPLLALGLLGLAAALRRWAGPSI